MTELSNKTTHSLFHEILISIDIEVNKSFHVPRILHTNRPTKTSQTLKNQIFRLEKHMISGQLISVPLHGKQLEICRELAKILSKLKDAIS